jgi:hypothetical protein
MRELEPQRKRLVVLCAAIGAMSGGPVLLKQHPKLLAIWITGMVVGLVYVMVQLARLKRQSR